MEDVGSGEESQVQQHTHTHTSQYLLVDERAGRLVALKEDEEKEMSIVLACSIW